MRMESGSFFCYNKGITRICSTPRMTKSEYQKVAEAKQAARDRVLKKGDKGPLLVVFSPGKTLSRDRFYQLLEGLLVLPSHVVVIGDEEHADVDAGVRGKISWVNTKEGRNKDMIEQYLMAADMALVFEEHMQDLEALMDKGVVIVGSQKSPFLENYKPNEETGNSFTFASMSPWDIFRALVRAHETYMFPYDWQHIMRAVLRKEGLV